MIECTDKNIWYKRKRRKKKFIRRFRRLIIISIILCSIIIYNNIICENIFNICYNYTYSFCTQSVNDAVLNSLNDTIKYSDVVYIQKNSNGDISMMNVNSQKVNYIGRQISSETEDLLKNKINGGIPIPLLAFSGIRIISGYGNVVMFKSVNVVSVVCKFNSKFTSVGINQTLHSIYANITTNTSINMPFSSKKHECTTSVLICESIIVGKVPDIYLKDGLFR